MLVQITGKNISIGDVLRERVERRLVSDVGRYFDGTVRAQVTVEKQRGQFRSDCTLHLATGIVLQAHAQHTDAYQSFDAAADHLEKRLKRYKHRLRDHHKHRREPVLYTEAASYVIAAAGEKTEEEPQTLNPAIVAEAPVRIPELSVGEAAMQLDISSLPFVIFRNGRNQAINIVYRREDGHIGWIDPGEADSSK